MMGTWRRTDIPMLAATAFVFLAALTLAISGLYRGALPLFLVSAALMIFRLQGLEARDFAEWLQANREALRLGPIDYRGRAVRSETELVTFQVCVSVLIITMRRPSRYFVVGEEGIGMVSMLYTLGALAFGWWGFPWGPIWTVQAVIKNLSGGYRCRVADLVR